MKLIALYLELAHERKVTLAIMSDWAIQFPTNFVPQESNDKVNCGVHTVYMIEYLVRSLFSWYCTANSISSRMVWRWGRTQPLQTIPPAISANECCWTSCMGCRGAK